VKAPLRYLAVFCLALLPRLAALGQYVTPDEPAWVLRSVHFRAALLAGRPADTLQSGHPGVTTMWAGSLAISVQAAFDPGARDAIAQLEPVTQLSPADDAPYRAAGRLLTAGRVAVALINALGLVALYALACRLVPAPAALLAAGLFALDPLAAGLGGLLHVDALATMFMALCLTSLPLPPLPSPGGRTLFSNEAASPARRGERGLGVWGVALAGVCAGLAVLSKSPSAYVGLFAGLLILAEGVIRRRRLIDVVKTLALFGAAALVTIVTLYPAAWAATGAVLARVFGTAGRHQGASAWPVFFMGRTTLQAGATFYPVALAFRLTPAMAIGVVLALATAVFDWRRRAGAANTRFAPTVLAYAIGYLILITLAAKKFDRYMLPIFPALALLAGLGWWRVIQWLREPKRVAFAGAALLALTAAQLAFSHPYYLTSYDPLLGGAATAARVLPAGWGEAAGAAARALAADPDTANEWIATAEVPSFAPLYPGHTLWLSETTWPQADQVLLTLTEQQSDPHGFKVWYAAGPAQAVAAAPYAAWLVAPAAPRALVAYLDAHTAAGEAVIFDRPGYASRHYGGPANAIVLDGRADPAALGAALAPAQGATAAWHVTQHGDSPVLRSLVDRVLSAASAAAPEGDQEGVLRYALSPGAALTPPAARARFTDVAWLIDAAFWPRQVKYPESAFLYAAWQPLRAGDYAGLVTLVDDAGIEWVSVMQPLNTAQPHEALYGLALPPGIPPGTYHARVQIVRAADEGALGAWAADDRFLGTSVALGEVQVVSPEFGPAVEELPILWRRTQGFEAGLALLGTGFNGGQTYSGDRVAIDLWWQQTSSTAASMNAACKTLRWSLSTPAGAGQSGTLPLSRYAPERWGQGEIVHEYYTLELDTNLPGGTYALAVSPGCAAAGAATLGTLDVLPRARSFDLPVAIGYPMTVQAGDFAVLRGYDLAGAGLRAGETVSLTLYWQARARPPEDYTISVKLLAPDRQSIVTQIDRFPQDGAAPTATWVPGQVVADAYQLTLPPDLAPGTYDIAVSVYSTLTGSQPLRDAGGWQLPGDRAILSSQVTILP
jgi:4-amino-4-deoxy-L-arabinose transferase-like glycosyltransferase